MQCFMITCQLWYSTKAACSSLSPSSDSIYQSALPLNQTFSFGLTPSLGAVLHVFKPCIRCSVLFQGQTYNPLTVWSFSPHLLDPCEGSRYAGCIKLPACKDLHSQTTHCSISQSSVKHLREQEPLEVAAQSLRSTQYRHLHNSIFRCPNRTLCVTSVQGSSAVYPLPLTVNGTAFNISSSGVLSLANLTAFSEVSDGNLALLGSHHFAGLKPLFMSLCV